MAGLRTVTGVRDSLVMVQRSPRWFSADTRVLNAVWSSCEAFEETLGIEHLLGEKGKRSYLISQTAS